MNRRTLLKSFGLGLGGGALVASSEVRGAVPDMKITRIRYYHVGLGVVGVVNQSSHVVTVETDQGITGIGEGGHRDSIEQLAGMLIGENPLRTPVAADVPGLLLSTGARKTSCPRCH